MRRKMFTPARETVSLDLNALSATLNEIFDNRSLSFSLLWTPGHRVFLLGLEARRYQEDPDAGWVAYLENPDVDEDGEITIELSGSLKIEPGVKYEVRFLAIAPKPVPKAIAVLVDAGVAVQIEPKPPKIHELKGNTPWPFQGTYTPRKEAVV